MIDSAGRTDEAFGLAAASRRRRSQRRAAPRPPARRRGRHLDGAGRAAVHDHIEAGPFRVERGRANAVIEREPATSTASTSCERSSSSSPVPSNPEYPSVSIASPLSTTASTRPRSTPGALGTRRARNAVRRPRAAVVGERAEIGRMQSRVATTNDASDASRFTCSTTASPSATASAPPGRSRSGHDHDQRAHVPRI